MTTHAEQTRASSPTDCFLCALDHHPCAAPQLSGRIVAARERAIDGETLPFITIDSGTTLISLALTSHYRSLVQQLAAIDLRAHHLTLRVYHLPAQPTSAEYKDRPLLRYTANSYTLAVLEADMLLNITDLSQAEYCSRQYLLQRLIASPPSAASVRGNLVHYAFKELLKAHDRGDLLDGHNGTTPLGILQRHFEQALSQNGIDMALANVAAESMREDVAPHLESLAMWFQNQSATLWDMPAAYTSDEDAAEETAQNRNQVRAETFLLAPEIGLRGRLDLFWQQASRQRFLELKTGGGANLPKPNHRSQVLGYHAQLAVRRDPTMKRALATLLYSGTPGEAEAYGIPFDVRNLQRVNELRNLLVLSHVTGLPAAPPGPRLCAKCAMQQQCSRVSDLLDWQPPLLDENVQEQYRPAAFSDADRAFFARFYQLLRLEERESERQMALLWREDVEARCQRGAAIKDLTLQATETNERGEWLLTFACDNQSELREGDEILLSDGDPITGSVVTGTIIAIGARSVTVWTPELIANPALIDKYANNLVHTRTTQNLYRWLHVDPHLRDLVAGRTRPRFDDTPAPRRPDFNDEQNLAVERAMQARDYLLIQGPPGTGKTSVIAEIVKRLCGQGQRVLLAAFTNQAVDNMLTRLDAEGFHDYLRLGHERSVHDDVQGHLLKRLVTTDDPQSAIRDLLSTTPVIASTTATWSSDKYDLQFAGLDESGQSNEAGRDDSGRNDSGRNELRPYIDVAIIDEASQLTIPSILGALRFARRFILVGDEQQLPPLVLSKEAAAQGLADSLFSTLKRLDFGYMNDHPTDTSACVSLTTQYRMNRWICNFSSKVFYEGKLVAAPAIASRVLDMPKTGARLITESPAIARALQPEFPLVFVEARDAETSRAIKSSSAEARAVRALVQGLLARGIAERDIGIIAPYRAQVANIRRHLFSDDTADGGWHALALETPMSIDTVDRFQGGERVVIIMSFATTTAPEPASQLYEFLTNPNRLNVALTRAQRKLIVVGCSTALRDLPYFGRLLAYCESMGTMIASIE